VVFSIRAKAACGNSKSIPPAGLLLSFPISIIYRHSVLLFTDDMPSLLFTEDIAFVISICREKPPIPQKLNSFCFLVNIK
jgi:hypothetical protein